MIAVLARRGLFIPLPGAGLDLALWSCAAVDCAASRPSCISAGCASALGCQWPSTSWWYVESRESLRAASAAGLVAARVRHESHEVNSDDVIPKNSDDVPSEGLMCDDGGMGRDAIAVRGGEGWAAWRC